MADGSLSKGKVIGIVVLVLVVIWIGVRLSKSSNAPVSPGGSSSSGGGAASDDSILASCTPGTFTGKSDRLSINVTVKGKKEGIACEIVADVDIAQGAGFIDKKFDKNGDGKLSMNCSIPLGTKNFAALTTWIKGVGINGCEGEYRDFVDSFGK